MPLSAEGQQGDSRGRPPGEGGGAPAARGGGSGVQCTSEDGPLRGSPFTGPLAWGAGKAPRAAALGRPSGGADPQRATWPNAHLPAPLFFVKQGSDAGKANPRVLPGLNRAKA